MMDKKLAMGQERSGKGAPGLNSNTVRSVHLTLHCAFERAVKERLIPRNPTDDCIAPKVQKVEMNPLLYGFLYPSPDISACGSRCGPSLQTTLTHEEIDTL